MLSDAQIRALPAPEIGVKRYWDKDGLCLQVSKTGSKTFYLVHGQDRRFLKLGRYGVISLADARAKTKQILAEKTLGTFTQPSKLTVADALAKFYIRCDEKNKVSTAKETKRLLARLDALHGRPITALATQDVLDAIDTASTSLSERRHVFVAARTFFRWCARQRLIKASPLHDLQPPGKPTTRDRVLTDAELKKIYKAAQRMDYPFGFIVLLCIHCAFRINEAARLKWSYVSLETITLPKDATKNNREHMLPNLVAAIIAAIPRTSDHLFLGARGRPFNQWDRYKKRLDALAGVTGWTLHDLRRTAASKMAEWQCGPPHVIERILNHATGSMSQIALTYNRHSYLQEMRACLEIYERRLSAVVSEPPKE